MTISDINNYVSFRANTNTTEYSTANRLINTNRWYHKVADMIVDSSDDITWDDFNQSGEAIITKTLVANQKYVQLAATDEILRVQRVEVSYDGTNWYKAEPINQGEIASTINLAADINNVFATTKPYYELRGLFLYLYPVPTANGTNQLKIWVKREADEFTSAQVSTGTREPGFDEPWHVMIALGMAYDWFVAKKLFNDATLLQNELTDYENRLRRAYGKKDEDRHYELKAAFENYD